MNISGLTGKEKRQVIREKGLHEAFLISIVVKGLLALAETILGLMLLFSSNVVLFVLSLAQDYLIDDPEGFFATHFQRFLSPSHDLQVFGGLYLLSHGVVKVFLVAGLLRNKLWAYPASLAVFSLFILYQIVKWLSIHSGWLLVLTIVDIVVMWLIWHEYRQKVRNAKIS